MRQKALDYNREQLRAMDEFFIHHLRNLGVRGKRGFIALTKLYRVGQRERHQTSYFTFSAIVRIGESDTRFYWYTSTPRLTVIHCGERFDFRMKG